MSKKTQEALHEKLQALPLTDTIEEDHVRVLARSIEYNIYDAARLYAVTFGRIPNTVELADVQADKAQLWFVEQYGAGIRSVYFRKARIRGEGALRYDDVFYILTDNRLVAFDTAAARVDVLFAQVADAKTDALIAGLQNFKSRRNAQKPTISILASSAGGIQTVNLDINKPRLRIEDNYNDDFPEVHRTILKRLRTRNDKGLVLLHGKPGTGKTNYIRYLISSVRKNVIFLPPNMASAITNPDLVNVLLDNPNSIFVIEDAENIVVDRELQGASPVSALLNLSDGLLSDCMHIQMVCSFNTDLSRIDDALLRKGRLIARYEFGDLLPDKAQALSDKLGFRRTITAPTPLSAIYNQDEATYAPPRRRRLIGFGAG